jgi:hypothetical protein
MTKPASKYRTRRRNGNKNPWCLIALHDDGSEIDPYYAAATALSLDTLVARTHDLVHGKPVDLVL